MTASARVTPSLSTISVKTAAALPTAVRTRTYAGTILKVSLLTIPCSHNTAGKRLASRLVGRALSLMKTVSGPVRSESEIHGVRFAVAIFGGEVDPLALTQ